MWPGHAAPEADDARARPRAARRRDRRARTPCWRSRTRRRADDDRRHGSRRLAAPGARPRMAVSRCRRGRWSGARLHRARRARRPRTGRRPGREPPLAVRPQGTSPAPRSPRCPARATAARRSTRARVPRSPRSGAPVPHAGENRRAHGGDELDCSAEAAPPTTTERSEVDMQPPTEPYASMRSRSPASRRRVVHRPDLPDHRAAPERRTTLPRKGPVVHGATVAHHVLHQAGGARRTPGHPEGDLTAPPPSRGTRAARGPARHDLARRTSHDGGRPPRCAVMRRRR